MSQTYFALLTAVGEAKLANAAALGTQLQISRMAVGDGNGNLPVPSRTQTALINECYRADLNELKPDPANASQIIAELVIPETEGGYWLREMGLFDASGDLIAVSNCPPSYKPQMAEGSGRTQVLRMVLIVSSTAAVQLKIDPSVVLATRAYADSLIVVHQAAADPHPQYQLRGAITSLSANTQLAASHEGLLLLSAEAGARTYTLPAANAAFGVRELVLRRTDITANALVIAASGTDKLMLDTTAEAAGQTTTELLFAGDFLRLRSDKAGKWWCVGQAQLPGSIASGLTVYSAAGNYAYTVPPVLRSGRRVPMIKVIAGGGGGSRPGTSAGSSAGGGGGGGGVAHKAVNLAGISSVEVIVGAGGPGATSNGSAGSPGGASSFGAYLSATPGAGGGAGSGAGAGGIGVGGDSNSSLGPGGPGFDYTTGSSTNNRISGYGGGPGGWGLLANSGAGSVAGQTAVGPGGGGSGGVGAGNGGAGAAGTVEIEW
ncbi:phage tail protein [Stutzerimonas xanthomarina]|uniref:phage tail protein n=1 Tax=Stutzerimonas xanthomarina TaxID=271420 RepID=UPI003AA7B73D